MRLQQKVERIMVERGCSYREACAILGRASGRKRRRRREARMSDTEIRRRRWDLEE